MTTQDAKTFDDSTIDVDQLLAKRRHSTRPPPVRTPSWWLHRPADQWRSPPDR